MSANLITKTLRDYRWAIAWYGLGVAAYGLFIMWFYPSMRGNAQLDQFLATYPRGLLEAFGVSGSLTQFPAFISGEYLSFMWVVIVLPLAISAGSAAVALEIDRGTIQALLAMPLSRTQLVVSKWLALAAMLLAVVAASVVALLVAARWFGIDADGERLVEVGVLGWTFFLTVGSYTVLCSAFGSDRGRPVGVAIGITAYGYLANLIVRFKENLHALQFTTIFSLWDPQAVLEGRTSPWPGMAILLVLSLVCVLAAALWLRHRDIAP